MPLGADAVKRRADGNYNIMVRLKPGVSVRQAKADVDIIAGRIRERGNRSRAPRHREFHVVLDNLNTHKPKDNRWLKKNPNVHLHVMPTYSSWLNQVGAGSIS